MKYTMRASKLAERGKANIQVSKRTRDEVRRLASEYDISQGAMVERLVKAWVAEGKRVKAMIEGGSMMKLPFTRHCDECEYSSWSGEGLLALAHKCAKGHKPRFYYPKGPLDYTAGFKRRCEDYKERKATP